MQFEKPSVSFCSIRRLIKAFGYSVQGLRGAFATEAAFRLEVAIAAIALPAAFLLDATSVERALLVGSILLVLMAELVNSAIEAVVDRISTDMHPLAGRAKDIGSAIVLIALVNAGAAWGMLLLGL